MLEGDRWQPPAEQAAVCGQLRLPINFFIGQSHRCVSKEWARLSAVVVWCRGNLPAVIPPPMRRVTLVRGARQLLTLRGMNGPRRRTDLRNLGLIQDGAVLIVDGRI